MPFFFSAFTVNFYIQNLSILLAFVAMQSGFCLILETPDRFKYILSMVYDQYQTQAQLKVQARDIILAL